MIGDFKLFLEGLRREASIAEICRREGIVPNLYYRRSKDLLEAGRRRLAGDTACEANSSEVGNNTNHEFKGEEKY